MYIIIYFDAINVLSFFYEILINGYNIITWRKAYESTYLKSIKLLLKYLPRYSSPLVRL